jgi:hypothetical protein
MAHFAKVNTNNVVEEVLVISNDDIQNLDFPESEPIGQQFIQSLGLEGNWLQTSYNSNFRKNYAGIDFKYDMDRDAFIPPSPFLSWVLNEDTCQWEPPIPYPPNRYNYYWDEDRLSWVEINENF